MLINRLTNRCRVENFPNINANDNESTNTWLVFNDKNIQDAYEMFRSADYSILQFILMASFFTILLAITVVDDTFKRNQVHSQFLFAFYLKYSSSLVFIVIVVIPLWMVVYYLYCGGQMTRTNRFTFFVELSVIFGGTFSVGLSLLAIALGAEVSAGFLNTAIFALSFPALMSLIFKHPNLKILFMSWLISFIFLVVSFAITRSKGIFIFLTSFVLIYQAYYMEYRTVFIYRKELSRRRLEESYATLEAQKGAKFVEDLRHMIGNVAHDLKTPTQSFSVCLEQLELSLDSLRNSLSTMVIRDKSGNILEDMSQMIVQLKASNLFMSMMINRTIDFTKASQGRVLSPKMASIDILETLEWPLNCMRSMKTGIPINFEALPSALSKYIITDGQWLQENILCLISNAVKYSNDGSVDIRVTLRYLSSSGKELLPALQQTHTLHQTHTLQKLQTPVEESKTQQTTELLHISQGGVQGVGNPMIRFEVEDHGIGIPVEMRQELFAPFKQAQRLAGGTGLGLYSMLRRMEALSGSCGVEDRRDGQQGSLFWFMMPYKPDHYPTPPAAIPPNAAVSDSQSRQTDLTGIIQPPPPSMTSTFTTMIPPQSYTILLVDDSVPILKTLEMALKKMGHNVQTAGNGAEALIHLINRNETYDVVVMDLQMPVMDGMEAVRRLRAHEVGRGEGGGGSTHPKSTKSSSSVLSKKDIRCSSCTTCTPYSHQLIIGMSANSDDETREEALETGMDGFLPKPFYVSVLLETIHKMIPIIDVDNLV